MCISSLNGENDIHGLLTILANEFPPFPVLKRAYIDHGRGRNHNKGDVYE